MFQIKQCLQLGNNMVWNQVQLLKGPKVYHVRKKLWWPRIFLAESLFCDEWLSCLVLHDAAINITNIYLIASRRPELHLLFPSDRRGKFISNSLEIQVQGYVQQHWEVVKISGAPTLRMLDFFWQFLALLAALRPRATVALGVHRGAFRQQ